MSKRKNFSTWLNLHANAKPLKSYGFHAWWSGTLYRRLPHPIVPSIFDSRVRTTPRHKKVFGDLIARRLNCSIFTNRVAVVSHAHNLISFWLSRQPMSGTGIVFDERMCGHRNDQMPYVVLLCCCWPLREQLHRSGGWVAHSDVDKLALVVIF